MAYDGGYGDYDHGNLYNTKQDKLLILEEQYYSKANKIISERITPLYNGFLLIFAGFFAYFLALEQPQCFSKEGQAFGVQYMDTENVSDQFYWLSLAGVFLLLLQALLYNIQTKDDMQDATRPWILLTHLMSLIWFITLQYYRFKQTGRACSGDYIQGGFGSPFGATKLVETEQANSET